MKPANAYTRIKGSHGRRFLEVISSDESLWEAGDHLLLLRNEGYSQVYKRFYYRDVQALIIKRDTRGKIIAAVCGLLFAVFLFLAIWIESPGGKVVLFLLAASAAFCLLLNWLKGPTCRSYIQTMVQTTPLPMTRLHTAERIIANLRRRLEAVQGKFAAEAGDSEGTADETEKSEPQMDENGRE